MECLLNEFAYKRGEGFLLKPRRQLQVRRQAFVTSVAFIEMDAILAWIQINVGQKVELHMQSPSMKAL